MRTKAADWQAAFVCVCLHTAHYGLLWLNWHNQFYYWVRVYEKTICTFFLILFTLLLWYFFALIFFLFDVTDLFASTVVSVLIRISRKRMNKNEQLVSWCLFAME